MMLLATLAIAAQQADGAPPPPKPGKPINAGEVLSGELERHEGAASRTPASAIAMYQITSEPRRLPAPNGLCNLETGPETFQLVTSSDAQATQLKNRSSARKSRSRSTKSPARSDAGQMSEAVITKWSVVTKQ